MNNSKKPAFPVTVDHGLTKRELFAMAAMQGILSAMDGWGYGGNEHYGGVAKYSVKYADALLKELNK